MITWSGPLYDMDKGVFADARMRCPNIQDGVRYSVRDIYPRNIHVTVPYVPYEHFQNTRAYRDCFTYAEYIEVLQRPCEGYANARYSGKPPLSGTFLLEPGGDLRQVSPLLFFLGDFHDILTCICPFIISLPILPLMYSTNLPHSQILAKSSRITTFLFVDSSMVFLLERQY